MGKLSRTKGHNFEREISRILTDVTGFYWRRGLQSRDGEDAPDSFCDELPYHLECKRYKQKINLKAAFRQAVAACGDQTPIVVAREDRSESMVYMRLEDFIPILVASIKGGE